MAKSRSIQIEDNFARGDIEREVKASRSRDIG
jgi:hypothetical protein